MPKKKLAPTYSLERVFQEEKAISDNLKKGFYKGDNIRRKQDLDLVYRTILAVRLAQYDMDFIKLLYEIGRHLEKNPIWGEQFVCRERKSKKKKEI